MGEIFLVAASIFLLLQQIVQGQTAGSGSGSPIPKTPECIEAMRTAICSIIPSSTGYQLINSPHISDIFETLYGGTSNSSYICSQFIIFSACFYSLRDCDPKDNGTQLLFCEDECPLITDLYHDCVRPDVVQRLISGTENSEVERFLNFSLTFDCSKNETYALPGVKVSTKSCLDLSFIHELFPDKNDQTAGNNELPSATIIALGVGIPLFIVSIASVLVILIVLVVKLHKSKTSLEKQMTGKISCGNEYNRQTEELANVMQDEDIKLSSEEQCYYEERFDRAVIAFDQLQMEETIGEGTFGVVYKAMLVEESSAQPVAVKMARRLSSKQELHSLLKESLLMKRFDHPNIVGLLGVCFDTPDGYPYLILPFMTNGNIRDYLKDKRVHPTNTTALPDGFSVKTLVSMCVDIAKGMEYLSRNKFVHRDLAARNCMLDKEGAVRVGDFGLARDVYSHLYYRTDKHSKVPVKWSAPEMLNDGLCTEMSDVWSYGVVCWEVFSLGSIPYPGVTNYDIPQYLVSGERLKKPPLCPQDMYGLMESCWKMKPEERPDFKQLVDSQSTLFLTKEAC